MGIVAQDGAARGRAARGDNPIIAAVTGGTPVTTSKGAIHELPDILSRVPHGLCYCGSIIRVCWTQGAQHFLMIAQLRGNRDHVETGEESRRKKECKALSDD